MILIRIFSIDFNRLKKGLIASQNLPVGMLLQVMFLHSLQLVRPSHWDRGKITPLHPIVQVKKYDGKFILM